MVVGENMGKRLAKQQSGMRLEFPCQKEGGSSRTLHRRRLGSSKGPPGYIEVGGEKSTEYFRLFRHPHGRSRGKAVLGSLAPRVTGRLGSNTVCSSTCKVSCVTLS